MSILKRIYNWIVVSSADPTKVSLTIKSVGLAIIPYLMIVLDLAHANIGSADLNAFFDTTSIIVQSSLTLFASVGFLFGLFRKIYNTLHS
jgi:hypothetical protein